MKKGLIIGQREKVASSEYLGVRSTLNSIFYILTSSLIIGLIALVGCAQANKTDVGEQAF